MLYRKCSTQGVSSACGAMALMKSTTCPGASCGASSLPLPEARKTKPISRLEAKLAWPAAVVLFFFGIFSPDTFHIIISNGIDEVGV